MKVTDEQLQKALKNLRIVSDLIASGSLAGTEEQADQGMKVYMMGVKNITQLIMIAEDLVHYRSKVEEMHNALTSVRDTLEHKKNDDRTSWSLWNVSNEALKGVNP